MYPAKILTLTAIALTLTGCPLSEADHPTKRDPEPASLPDPEPTPEPPTPSGTGETGKPST